MPWFKVDDNLAFHAKTVAAGNPAMGLWVRAGSWCAQQLTDGVVPHHMIAALGGTKANAKRLVDAGLWRPCDEGYRFHQWEQRQPNAVEVRAEQAARHEARAAAGRRGGLASGEARRKQSRSNSEAKPKQNEAPTRPVPYPSRSSSDLGEEVEVELDPASLQLQDLTEEAKIRRTLRSVVEDWGHDVPAELQDSA